MAYTRASSLSGACCSSCAHGGSCLGDVDVSTGIDTAPRPGESWPEYMLRLGKEQANYQQFVAATKGQAQVISQIPSSMQPPPKAQQRTPMSTTAKLALVAGAGLIAMYFIRRKP